MLRPLAIATSSGLKHWVEASPFNHRMAYQGEYFVERYGFEAAKNTPPIKKNLAADVSLSADYFSIPEDRIKHLESVLTIVDGQPVYGAAEFSNFSPPPLPVSPNWSPVKYYGGYHNDSIIYTGLVPLGAQQQFHKQSKPNLSTLNMTGRLSHFWSGLACACC